MGRHAANWSAIEPDDGGRRPLHADLFLAGPSGSAGPDRLARRSPEGSSRRPRPAAVTVVRAMDELSPAHRDLLIDLVYQGVSLQGAARGLGVPVETVKSRLYFAMRALRVVLDQQVADLRE